MITSFGGLYGANQELSMNFKTMAEKDVPRGRNGKHRQIVAKILSDLDQSPAGVALKVRLADLAQSKENVRSASKRQAAGLTGIVR